ncbi:TetR/AcrR family transcriptional regulator [Pseudonocardia acaciae]|uniref:TetR/AcrR family transcriptional regulator n=1 Tax=Pseudonocardia acaciae TaxID=551276 RepID=UPI00048AF086|nr:TetR/AcrR family transcriptional regulator [Pseudonocardia acaciae]
MPKIIDYDRRRSDIVDVTWDLITRGGMEAATMRGIASAAGFANGALKIYFTSKDDIIQATYERALGKVARHISLDELRGLDALREICHSAMPIDEERIQAGKVLLTFWHASLSNPRLHEKYLEHLEHWRATLFRFIAEGREDGDILTETPDELLVDQVVLLNAGATVMNVVGAEHSSVERQQRLVTSFLDGLTRP